MVKKEKAKKKDKEKDKKEKETKYIKTRHGPNIVVESVIAKGAQERYQPHFLCHYKDSDRWELKVIIHQPETYYMPLTRTMFSYEPYIITPELFESLSKGHCLSKQQLLDRAKEIIDNFVDCDEEDRFLGATIILLSYLQTKVDTLPILFFTGDPGSGKSRFNEVIAFLSYRGFLTADLRPANYYDEIGLDKADEGTSTICIENADGLHKHYETMLLLKVGRRRGKMVRRIIDPSMKSRSKRYYPTYALAIIDAEDSPFNIAFQRRIISIVMLEGDPKYDGITEKQKQELFNPLKTEFLIYRMKHFWDKTSNVDEDFKKLGIKTSVKERWLGLYKMIEDIPEYKEKLETLIKRDKADSMERRRSTLEAYMTSTLKMFLNEAKQKPLTDKIPTIIIKFSEYWLHLAGKLGVSIEEVNGKFKSPILDRVITKKLIGTRLKNRFRAEALLLRTEDGYARHYSILKSFIEKSVKKYGLDKEDL